MHKGYESCRFLEVSKWVCPIQRTQLGSDKSLLDLVLRLPLKKGQDKILFSLGFSNSKHGMAMMAMMAGIKMTEICAVAATSPRSPNGRVQEQRSVQ